MRVSYRWLVHTLGFDIPLPDLVQRLTMSGLEVESVTDLGVESDKLVVARILELGPHPNAENLSLCQVDAGAGEPLRIVCGAKNMKPGDWVPLAVEGAKLPDGMTIKKSKIRGEASQGMMCSARELGWSEEHEGLLILPQDSYYKPGESFDALMDIKITPNRPDCLSIYGLARDLAASAGRPLPPAEQQEIPETGALASDDVRVRLDASDECPRYIGRVIRGVTVGTSPLWLRRAVESAGLRSINNIVDVTNYLLIERGHPMHAFDLDKLGGREVVIRLAGEGEEVTTLDGQLHKLTSTDLLIADAEKPIALAGIMGCGNSEISEQTRNVFLECAYFAPTVIRRTSKRLAKTTDSSYRFERGTDWQNLDAVADRAARLIAEVAGGEIAPGMFDEKGKLPEIPAINVSVERVSSLLGLPLKSEDVEQVLQRLGFEIRAEQDGAAVLTVTPPAFRPDVRLEADIVEEVARIVGYDHIPADLPRIQTRATEFSPEGELSTRLHEVFSAAGFLECINYSFLAADAVEKAGFSTENAIPLRNPLSAEYAIMRPHLVPGLLASVLHNQNHGTSDVRLFEIGRVFQQDDADEERWQYAAVITGSGGAGSWRDNPPRQADFFDGKSLAQALLNAAGVDSFEATPGPADGGSLLHPGKSAVLRKDGRDLAIVGELHPRLLADLELKRNAVLIFGDFDPLLPFVGKLPRFREVPIFPSVTRDLAFVADKEVPAAEIETAIARRAKSLLADLQLFDVYEGERIAEGKRSLAYALRFSAPDRTLTDEEINQLQEKILGDLKAKLGVELRA